MAEGLTGMEILNFLGAYSAVLGLIGFILPGFIAFQVYDLLVPSQRKTLSQSSIELVAFGMASAFVNGGILLFVLLSRDLLSRAGIGTWYMVAVAYLFVTPTLIGIFSYWFRMRSVVQRFLPHPVPSPWDFAFRGREWRLVLCRLKSGGFVGGLFGPNSMVSNFPEPEAVFLEAVCRVDPEGRIGLPIGRTRGAIVRLSDCDWIEFRNLAPQEEQNEKAHWWGRVQKWWASWSHRRGATGPNGEAGTTPDRDSDSGARGNDQRPVVAAR